jgi:hypothetical protein
VSDALREDDDMRFNVTSMGWLGWVLAAGCADTSTAPVGGPVDSTEMAQTTEVSAVELEEAISSVEEGRDLERATKTLEAIANDPAVNQDDRDEALLGLSVGKEKLGDKDAAIEAIETLMMGHVNEARYATSDTAEKRLRRLLTGADKKAVRPPMPQDMATPVSHALAKQFKPDATGFTMIDIASFGPLAGENIEGLQSIRHAKSDQILEGCSVCEVNVGQSITSSGSWLSIPRAKAEKVADMPQLDRSLLLFYFDLADNLIPSRYDTYLAMPSDEIVTRLKNGKGVIAVRERKGARPTIVIAAPRLGQLPLVAKAFAALSELPTEPLEIDVPSQLQPDEIRAVIRGARNEQRKCYEELLARDPKAEGKLLISFAVEPNGKPVDVKLDPSGTTILDRTMGDCVLTSTRGLAFPTTDSKITIRYPLAFSPN